MNLKKQITIIFLLAVFALAGCSPPATAAKPTQYGSQITNSGIPYEFEGALRVKGTVTPAEPEAELAFLMSGTIKSVKVRVGDIVRAGDTLAQIETITIVAELVRAQSELKAAKAEYEYQTKRAETPSSTLQELEAQRIQVDLEKAAAGVTAAESEMTAIQNMLDQATLTAPFDGTITDVQGTPGETAYPGKTILKMANLQVLQVETLDLSEMDVAKVHPGQTVSIYINALDITVDGVVSMIAPQSNMLEASRVYKVTIQFNNQPEGLRWGMSVEVKLSPEK